jgi:hypothetical protein
MGEALIGYIGLSFASGLLIAGSLVFLIVQSVCVDRDEQFLDYRRYRGALALGIVAFSYLVSLAGQVWGALYICAADVWRASHTVRICSTGVEVQEIIHPILLKRNWPSRSPELPSSVR